MFNLNRLNVIGKDMPWHTKADVGFVLRGDVVKYSEIMNNPDLSHIWDDEYQRIVRISSRDLMHFFVDSGNSVILIDKNWRKVVEAFRIKSSRGYRKVSSSGRYALEEMLRQLLSIEMRVVRLIG